MRRMSPAVLAGTALLFAFPVLADTPLPTAKPDEIGLSSSQLSRMTDVVRTETGVAPVPGSVGDYNWSGLGGTTFWVDPKENLIAVWMMQAPGPRAYYRQLFKNLVYPALKG